MIRLSLIMSLGLLIAHATAVRAADREPVAETYPWEGYWVVEPEHCKPGSEAMRFGFFADRVENWEFPNCSVSKITKQRVSVKKYEGNAETEENLGPVDMDVLHLQCEVNGETVEQNMRLYVTEARQLLLMWPGGIGHAVPLRCP